MLRQQITADLATRTVAHQNTIASALHGGQFQQPGAPLVLLADGDSWFDYPLGGIPLVNRTDILAQLPGLCAQKPFILNLAHYGDATSTELGLARVQKISHAIADHANGPFDAILFSGGGNDIVGDAFCIWLNDAASVNHDPARALDPVRFNAVLDVVQASYLDLIGLRNERLPGAPIFTHSYDFALPTGDRACPCIGPWLKPALDYCGWTDPVTAAAIVRNALTQFANLLAKLAADPANNLICIPTQGT
ncbi:MAG TPA: SGNH/GDSL hydrolase family protein, partial [Verrucomicrobiae bacterium]|nr:SGNH/GDSL hydrolase family protein [Verrucomicrobiae bacterium]